MNDYINNFNEQELEVFEKTLLDKFGIRKVDKEQVDFNKISQGDEDFISKWIEGISWWKNGEEKNYAVVVYFKYETTKSPKNPFGFGPLVFVDITLGEIQQFIDAPSKGKHYLDYWAIGNKNILGHLANIINRLNKLNNKQETNKKELDNFEEDNEHSLDDIIEFFEKSEEKNKDNQVGDYTTSKVFQNTLRDVEGVLGISISGKLKANLLNNVAAGKFTLAHLNGLKYNVKQLGDALSKNGVEGLEDMFSRVINNLNPFLAQSRAIYKGKEAIKDLNKLWNNSYKRISEKYVRKNLNSFYELEKVKYTKKGKGRYNILGSAQEKNIGKKGMRYIWKDQLNDMSKKGLLEKGGKVSQKAIETYAKSPVYAVGPAPIRRITKNVIRIVLAVRDIGKGFGGNKPRKRLK